MNNATTEYTVIQQLEESVFILVLNATDGNMLSAKELQFPSLNFNNLKIMSSGKISENEVIIAPRDNNSHLVTIVNTDTWSVNTYYAAGNTAQLYSFVPLFSTDQIVLLFFQTNSWHYTFQTAYNKLDKTEMYTR